MIKRYFFQGMAICSLWIWTIIAVVKAANHQDYKTDLILAIMSLILVKVNRVKE